LCLSQRVGLGQVGPNKMITIAARGPPESWQPGALCVLKKKLGKRKNHEETE
jgi:hypothetical protein